MQPQLTSPKVSTLDSLTVYNNYISGQTLKQVGVWLRTEVFAHGQLYVASSKVGNPENLKFAVKRNDDGTVADVSNVVFKEVLLRET